MTPRGDAGGDGPPTPAAHGDSRASLLFLVAQWEGWSLWSLWSFGFKAPTVGKRLWAQRYRRAPTSGAPPSPQTPGTQSWGPGQARLIPLPRKSSDRVSLGPESRLSLRSAADTAGWTRSPRVTPRAPAETPRPGGGQGRGGSGPAGRDGVHRSFPVPSGKCGA